MLTTFIIAVTINGFNLDDVKSFDTMSDCKAHLIEFAKERQLYGEKAKLDRNGKVVDLGLWDGKRKCEVLNLETK